MAISRLRELLAAPGRPFPAMGLALAAAATAALLPSPRAPAALRAEATAGGLGAGGQPGGEPAGEPAAPVRPREPSPPGREGFVRPVPGRLVRRFSPPSSPYAAGHRGADLAAAATDAVRAAMAGTVAFSGVVAHVGWITIDHGGGLRTTYGPIEPRAVRAGQRVGAGQRLGRLAAEAHHLDWGAILNGAYIDPMSLLGRWEVHLRRPGAPWAVR